MTELSIIVPVFNERETAEEAIKQICEVRLPVNGKEIILVDDGCTDGTSEILDGNDWPGAVKLLKHDRNRGKGAAIRTALTAVEGTYTTIMDADLEYDPASIHVLLEPLHDGSADAVYGVRGFQSHSAYSFWYVVGNKFVTFSANLLYNRWLADIMTCHKIMRTEVFRSLTLKEDGFAIEPEITARLLRQGHEIFEVPVTYNARQREEGKKLTSWDGFRVLKTLTRCRFA